MNYGYPVGAPVSCPWMKSRAASQTESPAGWQLSQFYYSSLLQSTVGRQLMVGTVCIFWFLPNFRHNLRRHFNFGGMFECHIRPTFGLKRKRNFLHSADL